MPMNSDLLDELVDSQLLASIFIVNVNIWTGWSTYTLQNTVLVMLTTSWVQVIVA